jgi:Rad3-related DNA helicase
VHAPLQVHDIEDLAKIGKRHTACPYFVARHLADSAELIFCPYSYLLDPNIRRSTRVSTPYCHVLSYVRCCACWRATCACVLLVPPRGRLLSVCTGTSLHTRHSRG